MTSTLYFAYGSNLDEAQMRARCPGASLVRPAVLLGHALAFGGHSVGWGGAVATLVRRDAARVEGLLYRLGPGDLESLDRYEGHPHAYRRRVVDCVDAANVVHRAQVYVKPDEAAQSGRPSDRYFAVLETAYRSHGFDTAALVRSAGRVR